MGRKVFVSVLGTGFYNECRYVREDCNFKSSNTRYIQTATLEMVNASSWTSEDCAVLLLTDSAKKLNWDECISERVNPKSSKNEPYVGLRQQLCALNLPIAIKELHIPDGKTESEMWDIFTVLYQAFSEGDELYFDLTHSFRYLPMLVLILGNYSKFLKNVSIASITYGNYEARNNEGEAPIIDLLPLSLLQDWTYAAGQYVENGNVKPLIGLSRQVISPILRNNQKDSDAYQLNRFIKQLNLIISNRQTCRGMGIVKSDGYKQLFNLLPDVENSLIKPLNPVVVKIKESLSCFNTNRDIDNMFRASQWCFDNGYYQQTLTLLEEYVVSFFCERHNISIDDDGSRPLVNSAIALKGKELKDKKLNNEECGKAETPIQYTPEQRNLIEDVMKDSVLDDIGFINEFANLTAIRNDIAHSGMRSKKQPLSANDLTKKIKQSIDNIGKYLKVGNVEYCVNRHDDNSHILINLSNHPYSEWCDKQKQAAEIYGDVVDLPFPDVNPDGDDLYIQQLAEVYYDRVVKLSADKCAVIHLMGEMNLCFRLVGMLQDAGYECIASTTERIVDEPGPGLKNVVFRFVRFRPYC